MARWISYTDVSGKRCIRKSDETLTNETKEKEEREKKKKELDRKNTNEKWLNEWVVKRRTKRQERFIEFLHEKIPKERWEKYGERTIRRFVSKVNIESDEECWTWTGSINWTGYGHFYYGTNVRAHRFIYMLVFGEIPVDNPHIIHICDNPGCVNPNHLKADTHKGNMEDKVNKRRCHDTKGENNPNVRLRSDIVNEIRELWKTGKYCQNDLAKMYGVTQPHIGRIVRNKEWKNENYKVFVNEVHSNIGEKNHFSKYSQSMINQIREDYKRNLSVNFISEKYGVSKGTLYGIVNNHTWYDDDYQKWLNSKHNK